MFDFQSAEFSTLGALLIDGSCLELVRPVLLLHRNAPSDPQDPSQPQPFYINVAKNRHGRTGTVELNWYPPVNRFEDRSGKWPVMSWR